MNVQKINIEKFRSIDDIEIFFPSNKPLVLFGPNNAGKSNILSAIDRALGERYPSYIDMLESDYYMRDPETYPDSTIEVSFDEPIKYDRKGNQHFKFAVTYKYDGENIIHDEGEQLYLSKEDRKKITGYLVDADRNINYAFNYSSKYSILSKFSHEIHNAFTGEDKKALEDVFNNIKDTFQNNDKYKEFFENFKSSVKNSVKGFVHSLEVDFSAYDPNNYGKTMRVFAKEGDNIRGFEEFGTGEQQVLLMSFIKAYMETFSGEDFVLIIEEPEAHLHPLAQK